MKKPIHEDRLFHVALLAAGAVQHAQRALVGLVGGLLRALGCSQGFVGLAVGFVGASLGAGGGVFAGGHAGFGVAAGAAATCSQECILGDSGEFQCVVHRIPLHGGLLRV